MAIYHKNIMATSLKAHTAILYENVNVYSVLSVLSNTEDVEQGSRRRCSTRGTARSAGPAQTCRTG